MPEGFFLLLLLFFPPQFCLQKGYKPHRPQQGGQSGRGKVLHRALLHVQKPPNGKLRHGNPHTAAVGSRPSEPFSPLPQEHWGGCGTPLKALFSPKTLRRRSSRGGGRLFSIWRTRTSTSHTRGVVFPLSQRGCTYPSNHRSPTLPSLTALCHHRTRSGAKPRARCAQPAAGLSEMEMHPPNRGHGDGEAAGSAFPPPLH